ncbi:MAG: 3-hydroxyacyl-CoA dehydrogenase NAD-binding domain-containing protein [Chitinophagaceae bacterium]
MLPIHTICVCGAGTMGAGIAQVAAQNGFYTILYDVDKAMIEKAQAAITAGMALMLDTNKITDAERKRAIGNLRFTTDMNDCIADLFIEAIVEQAVIKAGLFNQLHEFNHSEVIFATNTSSLSVTAIAAMVIHPARVVGMHFFNPAPVMKLVEVVRGEQTSEETTATVLSLAQQMGKTPVLCKDAPGFIVNHVARPYYLEALRLLEAGIADPATIDKVMESAGFKMGPFKLMDLIGNDGNYAVSSAVYEALHRPERLKPSAFQKEKVDTGALGKKTGKGYYNYD